MGAITFLVGGARSGKSTVAVEIGRRHHGESHLGQVVFVATTEPFDADLRARVDRHRADRPPWPTVEAPLDIVTALSEIDVDALVIVDCVTVWVSNLLHSGDSPEIVQERTDLLVSHLARRAGPAVVVSNEVGMGVHPSSELGRCYRDLLGHVNQTIARAADVSLLLVAGRAVALVDPWDVLR
jgi:adenosyl cobinamide kinase/adenosyl cobinamide phosphate guanylyltransferase